MPSSGRSIPVNATDDIWYQHKDEIKHLYQTKRKPLNEVKRLMEENGFPEKPLSTWESKLREELQLRKKAKASDWHLIYQHILPHLENPGQKRLKRKIIIRLNETEIKWDKAWKEIRRSGALQREFGSVTETAPARIHDRVLSTEHTCFDKAFRGYPTSDSECTGMLHPINSQGSSFDAELHDCSQAATGHRLQLGPVFGRRLFDIFITGLRRNYPLAGDVPVDADGWKGRMLTRSGLQDTFLGAKHSRQLETAVRGFSVVLQDFMATSATARAAQSRIRREGMFAGPRLDLLPNHLPVPPRPSPDLGYRVALTGGNIQLGQFISAAMFLLSNNLHDHRDGDQGLELLCSLIDRDASLTAILLRSHLSSVRAAWESLLSFSMDKSRKKTFQVLISIGIHNGWLEPWAVGTCLFTAVDVGCYDTVEDILAYRCNHEWIDWWLHLKALKVAFRKGSEKCATLLMESLNVSDKIQKQDMKEMMYYLIDEVVDNDKWKTLVLDLLFAKGANVDEYARVGGSGRLGVGQWRKLVGRTPDEALETTRPTILDQAFYHNRPLFNKLAPYSKVPASKITRTRLLVALENGTECLRDCLLAQRATTPSFDPQQVQPLLELLLAEQFSVAERVDLRIIRSLLEFGVNFNMPSIRLDLQDLFSLASRHPARTGGIPLIAKHDLRDVLDMLLSHVEVVKGRDFQEAVNIDGTGVSTHLAPVSKYSSNEAALALATAARFNDFEAVEFFFRNGVDPHAFITFTGSGQAYSIQAVATRTDGYLECSLEMTRFLASFGARLVVTPEDSTPFDFAHHLLRHSWLDTLAKLKYVFSTLTGDKTPITDPGPLLQSCLMFELGSPGRGDAECLEIFEYLYSRAVDVPPGLPLAALVAVGAPEEVLHNLVLSGWDLNAYWEHKHRLVGVVYERTALQTAAGKGNEDLVRLFVQEGADVNMPARGWGGRTALQAACKWSPATEEEHQRKMRICVLLIENGADVNAAPSKECSTALMSAASGGDLELVALLLRQAANVNAPPAKNARQPWTALDHAADLGRLDTVKFLLNANALSDHRGATGYDGAIELAEDSYPAVADLIREHAAKVKEGILFNPELLKPQKDYRVYGHSTDDESSSDDDNFPGYGYESFSDEDTESLDSADKTPPPRNNESRHEGAEQPGWDVQQITADAIPGHSGPMFDLPKESWPREPDGENIQPADILRHSGSWTGQVTVNTANFST